MKNLGLVFLVSLVFLFGSAMVAVSQDNSAESGSTDQGNDQGMVPLPQAAPTGEKKPDQPESYDINYSYDPGGRRDPFISLISGVRVTRAPKGAVTVSDAKVVGITRSKDGYVAIIVGADNKSRFMKVGDKLYDGEIIAIGQDSVTFRQDLSEDTLAAPGLKSKEVVKRLHPVQEGT